MLIYIIDERKPLDSDSLKDNKKLESLIKLRLKYKIPLLILLTHADNYCDEVKKTDKNWEKTCKDIINKNRINLLSYVNGLVEKENKGYFKMKEDDVMHVVLVEEKVEEDQITDEEIIELLPDNYKDMYRNANEEYKKMIKALNISMLKKGNEFIKNEIKAFGQKELIEKIKENLPSQYHSALNQIN